MPDENTPSILRPSMLSTGTTASSSAMTGLEETIRRIVKTVFQSEGQKLVNNLVNPNHEFLNLRDEPVVAQGSTDSDRVPEIARTIREFSGNPSEFSSWKKSIERLLEYYGQYQGTPKYFGILMTIRNKIVGHADEVLESYNIPLNWTAIRSCLTWHYADKRDLKTLEYQLCSLVQGRLLIRDFYQLVYSHLSLILNKISCMEESPEAIRVLTNMYREKARDAFINGLNGDMPRLLAVKEPKDLPHALYLCEILENQVNFSPHNRPNRYAISAPLKSNGQKNMVINTRASYNIPRSYYPQQTPPPLPPRNINMLQYHQRTSPSQFGWSMQRPSQHYPTFSQPPAQPWPSQPYPQFRNTFSPPRPVAPKPFPKPEPMDVDRSMQSKAINYMNRPGPNKPAEKRPSNTSHQIPYKSQRNFHIESEPEQQEVQQQGYEQEWTPTMDEYETTLNHEYNPQISREYEQISADFTDIHFLE